MAQPCYIGPDDIQYCEIGEFDCVEDEEGNIFCPEVDLPFRPPIVTDINGTVVVYDALNAREDDIRCFFGPNGDILCPVGYLRCYENDLGTVFCPDFFTNGQSIFIIENMAGQVQPLPLACADDNCSNFPRIPVPPSQGPGNGNGGPNTPIDLNIMCGFQRQAPSWPGNLLVFGLTMAVLLGHRFRKER